MTYFLLGVGLLVIVLVAGRWFVNADPRMISRGIVGIGSALAIALGALLTVRGAALIGGPLVLVGLGGLFPWMNLAGRSRPSPGGVSEVDTDTVRMTLDRDSGAMDGVIKRGAHEGRRLSELDQTEVRALLEEARAGDPDGAALLDAYIARRFGGEGRTQGERAAPPGAASAMTEEEALSVLGLSQGASAEDIRAAYKRLMVKLHPDQGGSGWFAAKLNAARERLLGKD
ncbi:MAG: DnaJ domain-containing protein [Maricaulaceae bacterium]|jgi:hypothetical protein